MRIDALLLTRDFVLQRALERCVREFAIHAEHHTSGQNVLQRVAEWKFAAVIADCDHDDGMALLQTTRLEPRNRNSIAIAVARPGVSMAVPFRSGANFVLEKPVTRERVVRLLRAAYGLIAREHFRYLRHALDVPVTTIFPRGQSELAKSRNVSTRGLGLQSNVTRWPTSVRLQFKLSGAATPIEADAAVIWADACGRAGLRLLNFPFASQRGFDNWIAAHTEPLAAGFLRPALPHRTDTIPQGYPHAACS
jgi:CheY-like chemotaxis protein